VGVEIVDAAFANGDVGFRLAGPFSPTIIDAGDTLRLPLIFTRDVAGIYVDTLLLTDSCGNRWPLVVVSVADAEVGGVGSTGGALAGMRLTIAPNVIDGGALAATYSVPTGRAGTLAIVGADGRMVMSRAIASTGGIDRTATLDVSSLPAGRYWIVLRIDGAEIIEEITIVR
jgi:hypothetical protein